MTRKQAPVDSKKKENDINELSDTELEQVHGGSQSSGAGAGKVTFNPFSITRKIDVSSS